MKFAVLLDFLMRKMHDILKFIDKSNNFMQKEKKKRCLLFQNGTSYLMQKEKKCVRERPKWSAERES